MDDILKELDAIVGMTEVKKAVRSIAERLVHQKKNH